MSNDKMPPVACPPLLPPVPDWHPQPWAVTAWGGQMIDASFGDTFLFNGRMRPEAVLGVGVQKRIMRAGPLAIELEADLFSHIAKQQQGGEFNQSKPYADLPPQSFGEGVLGIGARVWVQPWLSFSFVEGISYNTDVSLYEKTFRENYTQLLNYLGFEVEAAVSSDLSLVGQDSPPLRCLRHLRRSLRRQQRLLARPALPLGPRHTRAGERHDASLAGV